MSVAVILTVLNEAESLPRLLASLAAQTRPPDEVVVAEGGSRDATPAVLAAYARQFAAQGLALRVVAAPGANIAQGRNRAIAAATADVIAASDAGVRLPPDWLARLTAPFADPGVNVVAGFFEADPHTVLETAMGATVLPDLRDVNPATFLPSSRSVAFRKAAWAAVGGYPEWLDFSEDVLFDLTLRAQFGRFAFVPEARVLFRPRGSLRALARQYYQYARGDGKANLFPRQHAVRYFTYLVVAPLLVYAALTVSPWLWLVGLLAGLAYLRLPLRRLWPRLAGLSWPARLLALAYLPLIRLVGDVAKLAGYPVGVWWRVSGGRRRRADL
ncbi:MAG: glycosyltransferase [Anaerolineales bacterium]|nr:glycosyltransferase [Anaerolineales bacterium]